MVDCCGFPVGSRSFLSIFMDSTIHQHSAIPWALGAFFLLLQPTSTFNIIPIVRVLAKGLFAEIGFILFHFSNPTICISMGRLAQFLLHWCSLLAGHFCPFCLLACLIDCWICHFSGFLHPADSCPGPLHSTAWSISPACLDGFLYSLVFLADHQQHFEFTTTF